VELYEFKPQQETPRAGLTGSRSRASLHAKAFVIDHKILVIGSMNLDPRSANLNTEQTLVIYSAPLAEQVAQIFERAIAPEESYHVTLADAAQLGYLRSIGAPLSPLVWTDVEDGTRRTYIFDPQAGFYRNALTGLFSLLPVNAEL
jgi:putative cardiolipin synthase